MKRIFALVLSLVFLLSCLVLPAGAMFDPSPVYQVQAASAYIVNTDTNIIVYDKDSTKQVSAGGLTKYMTLAVLLTNYADQLDNTFQMPFAISDYVHSTDNADMRSNETFTYREAIYAMVTRNANEAAMGLAYSLSGGDLAGWVSQMNTLSQRIGTTNSTWTDACGLDSGNVTTAELSATLGGTKGNYVLTFQTDKASAFAIVSYETVSSGYYYGGSGTADSGKKDSANTADDSQMVLWLGSAVLAAAAVVVLTYKKKRASK